MKPKMENVITLHNIYKRTVLKEQKGADGQQIGSNFLLCDCCGQLFFKRTERISADRETGGAYSRWCSQCASDDLGWAAESIFMNARHEKSDRWLLTPKGHAALAACPDTEPLQYIE